MPGQIVQFQEVPRIDDNVRHSQSYFHSPTLFSRQERQSLWILWLRTDLWADSRTEFSFELKSSTFSNFQLGFLCKTRDFKCIYA